jgi:adenylate cyclase
MERVRRDEVTSKLLQRFLSPQEAEFVMKEFSETGQLPAIDEHNLTILVADIVQSTRMAERLGARRFSRILSTYYQQMTEVVFSHHGLLNKYIGDGLMAIFGLPNQPSKPEMRAVQAGIEMLQKLDFINENMNEKISIGVGINTGPAMAGYMGTQDYIEFSVIGYPVNIAW